MTNKWKYVGPAAEAYAGGKWIKIFKNPYERQLTYWTKELDRIEPHFCWKWVEEAVGPRSFETVKRKLWYYLKFRVVEHDSRTGKERVMTPAVCQGATRERVEAQFHFKWVGRTTASRVCAYVWGNGTKWSKGKFVSFFKFVEFGTEACLKDYHCHHLEYKGGWARPDHAVPGECVVIRAEHHRELHGGNWQEYLDEVSYR